MEKEIKITGKHGVSKTRTGTFKAHITCNGKCYYLGTFKTEPEASKVYLMAEQRVVKLEDEQNGRT